MSAPGIPDRDPDLQAPLTREEFVAFLESERSRRLARQFRSVSRLSGFSPHAIEDACQTTLLTIHRHIFLGKARRFYLTQCWLFQTARRAAVAAQMKTKRFRPLGPENDPTLLCEQQSGAVVTELTAALSQAVAALPDREREVVVLWFFDRWTLQSIAARFGVHEGSVRRWIRAIRRGLRSAVIEALARDGYDEQELKEKNFARRLPTRRSHFGSRLNRDDG